jgi:hypothetical protein
MSKSNQNSLFAYLKARGVLENGTPEEIAAAKRDYRRDYERLYKRRYRVRHSEVRFTFNREEQRLLLAAAAVVGIDNGTFAKEATLARLHSTSPGSDTRVSREVLQKVALIHSEVRHLCRQRPSGFLERRIVFDRLVEQVGALEEALRESLRKNL